jgi:hypothetical protein
MKRDIEKDIEREFIKEEYNSAKWFALILYITVFNYAL